MLVKAVKIITAHFKSTSNGNECQYTGVILALLAASRTPYITQRYTAERVVDRVNNRQCCTRSQYINCFVIACMRLLLPGKVPLVLAVYR